MTRNAVARSLTVAVIAVSLINPFVRADLQQALTDGQAGRFTEARTALSEQIADLEQQLARADIQTIGRNCAAIGFNSMLIKVASDCIDGTLPPEQGKALYEAAQAAGDGQLPDAASLARKVISDKPLYAPAHFILGRILMGRCLQDGVDCEDAIGAYRKAVELDATLTLAHLDMGILHSVRDEASPAVAAWEAACGPNADPAASRWAHLMLSILYCSSEDWAEAQTHASQAESLGLAIPEELRSELDRHPAAAAAADDSAAESSETQTPRPRGQGNFFSGLFGPIVFIVSAPGIIFSTSHEGSNLVDSLLAQTWGAGSASYRLGFICGVLILVMVVGGIGSATSPSKKPDSQPKE